jgi:hypothetical protein
MIIHPVLYLQWFNQNNNLLSWVQQWSNETNTLCSGKIMGTSTSCKFATDGTCTWLTEIMSLKKHGLFRSFMLHCQRLCMSKWPDSWTVYQVQHANIRNDMHMPNGLSKGYTETPLQIGDH